MTPKEKAIELVEKFYPRATSYSLDRKNQNENAKQCALILVDEIYSNCADPSKNDYWIEVKNELDNL
jgi:hypothetical protein